MHRIIIGLFFLLCVLSNEEVYGSSIMENRFIVGAGTALSVSERYISVPGSLDRGLGAFATGGVRLFHGFYIESGVDWHVTEIKKGVFTGSACRESNATCRIRVDQHTLDFPFRLSWRYLLGDRYILPVVKAGLNSRIIIAQNKEIQLIEKHGISDDRVFTSKNREVKSQLTSLIFSIGTGMHLTQAWYFIINMEGGYHWANEYMLRPHTAYEYNWVLSLKAAYSW